MDIGAATGGFTDCMLQNGASLILAVENGVGQLHPMLMENKQVISWENTDIRSVDREKLPFLPEFMAVDLSFISITHVLPKIVELSSKNDNIVLLIKPQFEAGPKRVGKKGVIHDKIAHIEILQNLLLATNEVGLEILGLDFSPIKGQNGNIEYLLLATNQKPQALFSDTAITRTVNKAFAELM